MAGALRRGMGGDQVRIQFFPTAFVLVEYPPLLWEWGGRRRRPQWERRNGLPYGCVLRCSRHVDNRRRVMAELATAVGQKPVAILLPNPRHQRPTRGPRQHCRTMVRKLAGQRLDRTTDRKLADQRQVPSRSDRKLE